MEKLSIESVGKMEMIELVNELCTNRALTPVLKQAIQVRITSLASTPVEKVQEKIAQDATTSTEKKPKNKPNETTRTITSFKDDTKGIRAGSMVTFLENKNPDAKVITGQVQRLFDFWQKPERQEAKIMVTLKDGKTKQRFYRFEKDLTPVITTPVSTEGEGI